jgi:hypothetical protein
MPLVPAQIHPVVTHHLPAACPALALAAVLACPLPAIAEGGAVERTTHRLPEVLNAAAAVPAVTHASAFGRYRRLGDTPVGSWRDANDTVARIGGWRVYTRQAHAPEPPQASQAAASAPVAAPAPAPASAPAGARP